MNAASGLARARRTPRAAPAPARSAARARAGCASRDSGRDASRARSPTTAAGSAKPSRASVCERLGIVLDAGEDEIAAAPRASAPPRTAARSGARPRPAAASASAAKASPIGIAQEDRRCGAARRRRRAACGSARRRPSAGDARRGAGSDRRRSARRAASAAMRPAAASASSAVAGRRRRAARGMRPPQISCCVWAKNSISRMPPRPSLMLWPATAMRAAAAMGVDLALDRMDVLDRGEIEMLAPQEGRELGEERGAGVAVAGHRPRLDQGGALPVLAGALVIGERRRRATRRRRRGRDRAAAADRCGRHSRRRCARP